MCLNEVTGRTCNGDSGGFTGVQPEGGNRWVQHGVTSFGIRVSKYIFVPKNVRKQKFFSLSPELSRPQHEDGHDQGVPVRGLDQGIRARCTDCMIDKAIGKKRKCI